MDIGLRGNLMTLVERVADRLEVPIELVLVLLVFLEVCSDLELLLLWTLLPLHLSWLLLPILGLLLRRHCFSADCQIMTC